MNRFQIIVPVFNEEECLHQVLTYAKESDYLRHLVFVDDASTDSSLQILQDWAKNEGIMAISLNKNQKKEGAIRVALNSLEIEGQLAPYTVLLDSDSLIAKSDSGELVENMIEKAINHMKLRGVAGMGFQIDAITDDNRSIFSYGAFADYSAMQFDLWLVGKQRQLWVINGPCGIFETKYLLDVLRSIVPDFETGDLLITVELMKDKRPIEFYRDITVRTFVPTSVKTYFNQRRRWERGTTKVLWNERKFYASLFCRPSLLALSTLIHLSLYIGIVASLVLFLLCIIKGNDYFQMIAVTMFIWFVVSILKGGWLWYTRHHFSLFRYCLSAVGNGVIWPFVTTPARLTGFVEAVAQLIKSSNRSVSTCPECVKEYSWLSTSQNTIQVFEDD